MNHNSLRSSRNVIANAVMLFVMVCLFLHADEILAQVSGKAIFEARCSMCHGMKGDGKGIAAPFVSPRPRDFSEGKYKFRSTESGSIPTDEDLKHTIREGLHSTAMPDWKDFISGDSLNEVVGYIKSLSRRFSSEQPKLVRVGMAVPSTGASVGAGRNIYAKLQCASCHGSDGRGKDAVANDLKDDWGFAIPTPDLTEPWTFRRGNTAKDVYLSVRTGIDGTPMPSFVGSVSDQELWNLANYVISLGRNPVWMMSGDELQKHYSSLREEESRNPVAHGRALVKMRGCGGCHSTYDEHGMLVEEMEFAGGLKWSLGPYGNVTSINLTSDKETGLGNWSDEEIKRGITRGIRKDGSRSIPFPMPWTAYANLSPNDLDAIVAYLRSLPPVRNKIPEPEPLGFFPYMWAKFKMLILKEDFLSFSAPGNAGDTKEGSR